MHEFKHTPIALGFVVTSAERGKPKHGDLIPNDRRKWWQFWKPKMRRYWTFEGTVQDTMAMRTKAIEDNIRGNPPLMDFLKDKHRLP